MEKYKVGDIIRGQITGIEKYGAFVNVDPYYDGLIHISEIANGFVKNVSDYFKIGETIFCRVVDVDEDNLQLKLSIRNLDYKVSGKEKKLIESKKGFYPLKKMLPVWTEEKLTEMNTK